MPGSPIVALIALAATVGSVPAQLTPPLSADPVEMPTAPPDTITTARDRALRMTVPTRVNGQGPYAFTIDTGADRSVVSDTLAGKLDLPRGKDVLMHGIIGAQSIGTVKIDRLRVGTTERRGVATAVLPELSLGATGFLGIDAMADQSVILDFKRNRITMVRSTPAMRQEDADTIVVTGRSRFGQLILTDATINGRKVYAIIDTGAENSVGNPQLRKLMLGSATLRQSEAQLVGVTGAVIPAEAGVIPRIRLGGMSLSNMPIAYADAHTFKKFGVDKVPAILVGMDVLRGFERVAVDFRNREVRFLVGSGPLGRG